MRDDEERAEARRALSFLQSLRVAIPAALDDSSATKEAFKNHEADLIAKNNGTPADPNPGRRWARSKKRT